MPWTLIANLRGTRGVQGLRGLRGIQGLPGAATLPADSAVAGYIDTLGTSATKTALQKAFVHKPDLIERLQSPTYIAHRGGYYLYPEEGLEGMRAAAASQFLPEVDVKALADGTLVCLHDDTVDRTMTGQTGAPSALTREQWLAMQIRPAVKGGRSGQCFLFDDWLDEFGGKVVLVPEIKDNTTAVINAVIAAIKDRGLERSVIVQSFNFETCRTLATAGLQALFLFGSSTGYTPAEIKAAGINYVGPGSGVSTGTVAAMQTAELIVWVYTINTPSAWEEQRAKGVDGVFSNDPWFVAGRQEIRSSDPFGEGFGWPGIRARYEIGGTIYTTAAALAGNALQFLPVGSGTSNEIQVVHQGWAGMLALPVEVSMSIEFGADTSESGHGFGLVLYSNLSDPDGDFLDGAKAGQNGFTAIVRRNGLAEAWSYTDGAASVKFFTQALATQFPAVDLAPDFKPGRVDVTFRFTGSALTVEVPTFNFAATATHGLTIAAPLRFALRGVNSSSGRISNVRVRAL
ncbi:glycerophosphodiester phosphodiesterase [Arthrobacter sp. UYCu723]